MTTTDTRPDSTDENLALEVEHRPSPVGLIALIGVRLWVGVRGGWSLALIIVSLIVMIFMHELGHYLAAKRAGMKVTEFFLGFGPRLWSHPTDTLIDELIEQKVKEKSKLPDADWSFHAKQLDGLEKQLDEAFVASPLPETRDTPAVNDLLVRLRLGES